MPSPRANRPSQDFFEDVFEELAQFGEIEHLNVCDNLADHIVRLRLCARARARQAWPEPPPMP